MVEIQWIVLFADFIVTLCTILNSLVFGRIGRTKIAKMSNTAHQPLSVIVTAHNQAEELRKHLPSLLLQNYPNNFEVIVVDMASDDETLPLLEKMEEEYPMLRHTFTPVSARDISMERLALTLGIRSASYEWVILLHAGCRPTSPYWLRRMSDAIHSKDDAKIVVAPVSPCLSDWKKEYTFLWNEMLWLSFAAKHGAYRTGQCNVAYNQNHFMQHNGFASHAQLACGAIDIMVNRNSTSQNTAAAIRPESVVLCPPIQNEYNADVMYMETRRHLTRHRYYRLQYALAVSILPFALLAGISTIAWLGFSTEWGLLAIPVCLMLLQWSVYHRNFSKSMRFLGLQPLSPFSHIYALFIPWNDFVAWVRHKMTGKKMFRKKFI